jgi:hypothetical protein
MGNVMDWKVVAAAVCGVVLVVCAGLALSNPTLSRYEKSVLMPLAELEAEKLARIDRRAIEQEAANIQAAYASVHFDVHKLNVAAMKARYPLLGASLTNPNETADRNFPEILARARERALSRVDIVRTAVLHEVFVKLVTHSTRTSHGLWSTFATCGAGRPLNYTAIAWMFNEQTDNTCPIEGSGQ